jgi:hypothetical protein
MKKIENIVFNRKNYSYPTIKTQEIIHGNG